MDPGQCTPSPPSPSGAGVGALLPPRRRSSAHNEHRECDERDALGKSRANKGKAISSSSTKSTSMPGHLRAQTSSACFDFVGNSGAGRVASVSHTETSEMTRTGVRVTRSTSSMRAMMSASAAHVLSVWLGSGSNRMACALLVHSRLMRLRPPSRAVCRAPRQSEGGTQARRYAAGARAATWLASSC